MAAVFSTQVCATVPAYNAQEALKNAKEDIPNWMSYLPDDIFVAHVSIPGTHDAATGHEWESTLGASMSTTQSTTLSEQLEGGIRAFDFRPGLKSGTDYLVCAHGTTYLKLRLDEAFKILTGFLESHPKEFLVFHLFRGNIYRAGEGSSTQAQRDTYNDLCNDLFNKGDFSKYVIDYTPDLTVKDIRGKIVIFRRDRIDFANIEKAGNLTNWPGDKEQWSPNNFVTAVNASSPSVRGNIYVTDISSPKEAELDLELSSITDLYNFSTSQQYPNDVRAKGSYKPYWVMCFTSGEYAGSGTKAYLSNAVHTNPHLINLINTSEKKGPVGIVFSDWVLTQSHNYKDVDYKTDGIDLVNAIIENNFAYIENFILDSEIFQPIENNSLWNDKKQYFLRNIGSKQLLSSGATWGTHAVTSQYGIRVTPCYDKFSDTYILATTQGNGYVGMDSGNTFYVDFAPATEFKLTNVNEDGKKFAFTFEMDGVKKALTAEPVSGWIDNTEYMVEPRDFVENDMLQQWELIEAEDYFTDLIKNADPSEGVDLSDMLQGHRFWPNDRNNWSGVTDTYSSVAAEGTNEWNDKELVLHCHNKKTTSATLAKKTQWTVEKTIEGLPEGNYKLSFNAAEFNLKDKEGFSFLINDENVASEIQSAETNSAGDAAALFRTKKDEYTVSKDFNIGSDGKLTLNITNGEVLGTEACLFLDNFTLRYFGKKSSPSAGVNEIAEDETIDLYTISGLKIKSGATYKTALNDVPAGLYIIRSASAVRKVLVR